jgi:hypothetical protein
MAPDNSVLIDSNIFIDHFRGYAAATNFLESLPQTKSVLFSAITEAELVAGKDCADPERKEQVLHLLYRWNKIPVTNPIAILAGDITREYGLELGDAIIAASAILNDAELITKNTKDFGKVKELKIQAPY